MLEIGVGLNRHGVNGVPGSSGFYQVLLGLVFTKHKGKDGVTLLVSTGTRTVFDMGPRYELQNRGPKWEL